VAVAVLAFVEDVIVLLFVGPLDKDGTVGVAEWWTLRVGSTAGVVVVVVTFVAVK
jgi:hypothetical protein